jgi:hypothetical protein
MQVDAEAQRSAQLGDQFIVERFASAPQLQRGRKCVARGAGPHRRACQTRSSRRNGGSFAGSNQAADRHDRPENKGRERQQKHVGEEFHGAPGLADFGRRVAECLVGSLSMHGK